MPTAALGAGRQVGLVSRPAAVCPLWSRGHVRARSGRWLALVARAWSGLMCLETQGPRGGRQTLDLGGVAESLARGRLDSTCVSEVPRWACRGWPSASRCIPDGRSGRNVGMGTGAADGPEVGRAERRPGLKNTGPSAGRVGALGGSPETRRNRISTRWRVSKFGHFPEHPSGGGSESDPEHPLGEALSPIK